MSVEMNSTQGLAVAGESRNISLLSSRSSPGKVPAFLPRMGIIKFETLPSSATSEFTLPGDTLGLHKAQQARGLPFTAYSPSSQAGMY